jgi:hypothetical protein
MVSKLNKSLNALRAIAPAINEAADEANRVVKEVEHTLVRELGIGVSATSEVTREWRRRDVDDDGEATDEEVREYLGFGRVMGSYCIHVVESVYHKDGNGWFNDEVDMTETAWSICDRETRLRTFEGLPSLLENLAEAAKKVAESGKSTATKIRELMADDNSDSSEDDSSQAVQAVTVANPRNPMTDQVPVTEVKIAMPRHVRKLK